MAGEGTLVSYRVTVDPAFHALTKVEDSQFPYAFSLALNRAANDGQEAERGRIKGQFNIRRESWNMRGIKIMKSDRASKTRWSVIIQVAPEADYLNKFEEAGIHEPMGGRQFVWIPNPKVWKNGIVPKEDPLRPSKLKFTRDPHGRMEGNLGTYMIKRRSDGATLVMQNTGKTGHKGFTLGSMKALSLDNVATGMGPRMRTQKALKNRKVAYKDQRRIKLYTLKSKVTVPIKLQFVPTITNTVDARIASRFREAWDEAMRTAR
ncbi:hypothetical protein [Geothrix sp. 21YS21S-2]|uniref:hypothetical protein n=1 Tax=Geothrix sp. 21YS21S-2 TaxID=3068893 RepID=UPI0027BAE360|nr:hypothetical protein [Geothrix sp. 21YS21S-2]